MSDINAILASTSISGLDISEALSRINHSGKIYMRIIHSFIQNMPQMLDDLSTVTDETLANYSIKVHGVKGSCYGIGATLCGDAAFVLEKASKVGDLEAVLRDNGSFIELTRALVRDLEELEAHVESMQAPAASSAARPDPRKLARLLEATRYYNVEMMHKIIEELEGQSYVSGGEIVPWLRKQFDSFAYDKIIERLSKL